MEKELISTRLKKFLPDERSYIQIEKIDEIHEVEDEIIQRLVDFQEQERPPTFWERVGLADMATEYSIEYSYIDFKWLIIGEKLKHMNQSDPPHRTVFDDDYFATLIMK